MAGFVCGKKTQFAAKNAQNFACFAKTFAVF